LGVLNGHEVIENGFGACSELQFFQQLGEATEEPGAEIACRGKPNTNSFDRVFGTPFVGNGYVYGTSSDGELVCIKADKGERLWSTLEPNQEIFDFLG
jgi:outer membrane protein assembly factor BamB